MAKKIVVIVRQAGLGSVGPEDAGFGEDMFDVFLHTLEGMQEKPHAICFYTDGVKLLCEGSKLVPNLRILEGLGVPLVACGTCLKHFGLTEKLKAGRVGGMKDMVTLMMEADHTVTV